MVRFKINSQGKTRRTQTQRRPGENRHFRDCTRSLFWFCRCRPYDFRNPKNATRGWPPKGISSGHNRHLAAMSTAAARRCEQGLSKLSEVDTWWQTVDSRSLFWSGKIEEPLHQLGFGPANSRNPRNSAKKCSKSRGNAVDSVLGIIEFYTN